MIDLTLTARSPPGPAARIGMMPLSGACGLMMGDRYMAPVHDAARDNDVERLRVLLDDEPALIEAEGFNRWRPLHYACYWDCTGTVELLLERGACCTAINSSGDTPLMTACQHSRPAVVSLLLTRGIDAADTGGSQATALMRATESTPYPSSSRLPVLRLLLEDGRVPIDARDSEGRTALFQACSRERVDVARVLLLEGQADHTIPDNDGRTPIAAAVYWGGPNHACAALLEVSDT